MEKRPNYKLYGNFPYNTALPNLDERGHFCGFYGGFLGLFVDFGMSETKLTHPETPTPYSQTA